MTSALNERLLVAAATGDVVTVRKLIKDTPLLDMNVREYYPFGECALSKAVKGGHTEVVRLMLEANADANLYNAILVTPLHWAALGKRLQIARLLVSHGANLEFRTKNDFRPIDFCHYNTDIWQLLYDASCGKMPILVEKHDVPLIPAYAIPKPMPIEPAKLTKGRKGTSKKVKITKKGKKKH